MLHSPFSFIYLFFILHSAFFLPRVLFIQHSHYSLLASNLYSLLHLCSDSPILDLSSFFSVCSLVTSFQKQIICHFFTHTPTRTLLQPKPNQTPVLQFTPSGLNLDPKAIEANPSGELDALHHKYLTWRGRNRIENPINNQIFECKQKMQKIGAVALNFKAQNC